MKNFILLLFLFLFSSVNAQELNLYSLINKSYSTNKGDYSTINNKKLIFIKPKNISFFKTDYIKEKYSFEIISLKNEDDFKNFLKSRNDNTFLFDVIIDNIYENSLVVTLKIMSTNYKMYSEGSFPFFIFEDERKVLLKYNSKSKKWIFSKIIEISDEPNT
ncbi:MAG: hypothetical protein DI622_20350 [Chryseobacterium sp.]|uniref:hypothetical protein n=1 Tax=Chryseobacterium sp. TaxID=1871047 RepID=UPI000DB73FE8|nr:hypothetical protein [Chryseobacterium sp.]MPS66746.1 hypothetical protein [Chryseobacterium sp.]PZU03659.1 MAG: hypothetical protein DI622_20350 [Chryseobacterium sp.]